jgi:hypothetical protein
MTVHVVSRSVARSIVQLMQHDDSWRSFTLAELKAQPSCHESTPVVETHLQELVRAGFLSSHQYNKVSHFAPTETFMDACERQRITKVG